jgi:hypothetical protein
MRARAASHSYAGKTALLVPSVPLESPEPANLRGLPVRIFKAHSAIRIDLKVTNLYLNLVAERHDQQVGNNYRAGTTPVPFAATICPGGECWMNTCTMDTFSADEIAVIRPLLSG